MRGADTVPAWDLPAGRGCSSPSPLPSPASTPHTHLPSMTLPLALPRLAPQAPLSPEELDSRIGARLDGVPLHFLDGVTFQGLRHLNKMVRVALQEEKEVYTVDSARFIHGAGVKA